MTNAIRVMNTKIPVAIVASAEAMTSHGDGLRRAWYRWSGVGALTALLLDA